MRFLLFFIVFLWSIPFYYAQHAYATPLSANTPSRVVVSIAPQKWIVEQIAGENNLHVTVLVRPGMDEHSYEPTPSQMRACIDASIYFTIGLPFEEVWVPRIQGTAKQLVISSTINHLPFLAEDEKDTDEKTFISGSHSHERKDPHVWLSPTMVRYMIPSIVKELSKHAPEKASLFKKNAEQLEKLLYSVDATMKESFALVPQKNRVFLTFHPAWHYFANSYGLHEMSIEEEGKEPGLKSLKAVIDKAKEFGITTVFSEPQYPKTAVQAIANELNAKIVSVDPLAEDLPQTWADMTKYLMESWGVD